MYKVYIMVNKPFAEKIGQKEFTFSNVDIEDTPNYLTIWDETGTLAFRCPINNVERFVKFK